MSILTFDKTGFYIDGEPFRIIAGDVHYFRMHPDKWEQVLDLAVNFGLNTIQTYVPWNAHEPKRGKFDFSGMLDLASFLELCHKKGLKVLLRPTPYICSEWDLGGLPAWLLKKKDIMLRCSDPDYLEAIEEYYEVLTPIYLPYLSTNNGPIIAVVVENEYGSYGNDHTYLRSIADMLIKQGVDVPLYSTDGPESQLLEFGRGDESYFFGVNYRAKQGTSQPAKKVVRDMALCPFFVGEFWSGRSMNWGEPFYHRDPKETSEAYKEALELGGNVCFYMFYGGTNFGFMGGANYGCSYSPRPNTPIRYIPYTTSYDVDALVSENGIPTEKYYLCRDVLDEYLGRNKRPRADFRYETAEGETTPPEEDLYKELKWNLENGGLKINMALTQSQIAEEDILYQAVSRFANANEGTLATEHIFGILTIAKDANVTTYAQTLDEVDNTLDTLSQDTYDVIAQLKINSNVGEYVMTKLATLFHKFYNACRVKGEEESLMQARLALCGCVRSVIKNVLTMFNITCPESM